MARVKGAMMTRKRRNKTLKLAKGYWGNKSRHFKMANEQVMKSLTYAYVGRRLSQSRYSRLSSAASPPQKRPWARSCRRTAARGGTRR